MVEARTTCQNNPQATGSFLHFCLALAGVLHFAFRFSSLGFSGDVFAYCSTFESLKYIFVYFPTLELLKDIFAYCLTLELLKDILAKFSTFESLKDIFASVPLLEKKNQIPHEFA